MAVYDRKITVGEKKYTFIHYKGDWRVHCLRYDEPWMIYEKGSSAISAMMYDYEQLQAKNKQLKKALDVAEDIIRTPFLRHNIKTSLEKVKQALKAD